MTFKLSFKEWFSGLLEMFGSFSYVVPEDKEKQLYDFYMLSYLKSFSMFDVDRAETRNKTGYDPKQFSVIRPDENEMDNEDKIDRMIKEASNQLLPVLKENLLEAVFFSLCAEIRHVFDRNVVNDILEIVKNLGEEYVSGFKKYAKEFTLRNSERTQPLMRRPEDIHPDLKVMQNNYKSSYYAALKSGLSKPQFVRLMEELYKRALWSSSYGGTAWANICKGWTKLNEAQNDQQLTLYIDHIYDLQHNTGTVFNKVESYAKQGSYNWLAKALDHKAKIKSPHEIVNKISSSLRKLALRAIKNKTGKTLDQFKQEAPIEDKEEENPSERDTLNDKQYFKSQLINSLNKDINEIDGDYNLKIARAVLSNIERVSTYLNTSTNSLLLNLELLLKTCWRLMDEQFNISDGKILQLMKQESKIIETLKSPMGTIDSIDKVNGMTKEGLSTFVKDYEKIRPELDADVEKAIIDLLFMPNKFISAIKMIKDITGYPLNSSKNYALILYARNKLLGKTDTQPDFPEMKKEKLVRILNKTINTVDGDHELKIARAILHNTWLIETYIKKGLNTLSSEELLEVFPLSIEKLLEAYQDITGTQLQNTGIIQFYIQKEKETINILKNMNQTSSQWVNEMGETPEGKKHLVNFLKSFIDVNPVLSTNTEELLVNLLFGEGKNFIAAVKFLREKTGYDLLASKNYTTIFYARKILENGIPTNSDNDLVAVIDNPHTVYDQFDGQESLKWARLLMQNHKYNALIAEKGVNIIPKILNAIARKYSLSTFNVNLIPKIRNDYSEEYNLNNKYFKINTPSLTEIKQMDANKLMELKNQLGEVKVRLNPETINKARKSIRAFSPLGAVKILRDATGWSLKSSKELMQHLAIITRLEDLKNNVNW